MGKSLYFINPTTDFAGYYTAEVFAAQGLSPTVLTADLTTTTLAAMAPADFTVRLCEEYVEPVDFDSSCDFIGITGKITQLGRMLSIAKEFRRRGKTVIIGGPFASLSPEVVRPHCDILVRGEIEEIAQDFFADLQSGRWKDDYFGDKPDLSMSPVPKWSLYPNDRASLGALQTARGCPFECEFCDVIQYAGRKQRHKLPAQVLKELDALQRHGYRATFLADDNFTAYHQRAKELLEALKFWNDSHPASAMHFTTQVSIDVARDEALLGMCADAELRNFFIGIETPNQDSLRETKKRQNMKVDLVDQVRTITEHGIAVMAGMIVGFDHDGPDIFQRQYDFAMASAIPIFSLGALVAPAATPLHERMEKAGRLKPDGEEVAAVPWATNIVPVHMSEPQLMGGLQWLANKLYEPQAFGERISRFIDAYGTRRPRPAGNLKTISQPRPIDRSKLMLLAAFRKMGAKEDVLMTQITSQIAKKPETAAMVISQMLQYMQIRHMYERGQFWEQRLTTESKPIGEVVRPVPLVRRPLPQPVAV